MRHFQQELDNISVTKLALMSAIFTTNTLKISGVTITEPEA